MWLLGKTKYMYMYMYCRRQYTYGANAILAWPLKGLQTRALTHLEGVLEPEHRGWLQSSVDHKHTSKIVQVQQGLQERYGIKHMRAPVSVWGNVCTYLHDVH